MTDQTRDIKTIWLHLVSEGGRWIPREVAAALPDLEHMHMSATLNDMWKAGLATRFPLPGVLERYSYGVTHQNKVPRTLTLGELQSLGADKQPEATTT